MSIVTGIRERLGRLSGEKRANSPQKNENVLESAGEIDNANGGKQTNNNTSDKSRSTREKDPKWYCKQCSQCWDEEAVKADLSECSFCNLWVCRSCTKMKKTDFNSLARNDIFWACEDCLPNAKKQVRCCKSPQINETTMLDRFEHLESKLDEKLSQVIEKELPSALMKGITEVRDEISSTVEQKFTKLWSEVVRGDTPAAVNNDNAATSSPSTIGSVVKKAIREQKNEELQREGRANNIIIYRARESSKENREERKE